MVKLSPEERWRRNTKERLIALQQSGEVDRLRRRGLAIIGRTKRFTSDAWAKSPTRERLSRPGFREWYEECRAVAKKFGLTDWTLEMLCFVSDYDPMKLPFPVETVWPRITVVTDCQDELFGRWLSYEGGLLRLDVNQKCGEVENKIVNHFQPETKLEPLQKPPWRTAFILRVETPPDYPPEAAQELQREAQQQIRELLRRLGYRIPQRSRPSALVNIADKLEVGKPLKLGRAYEIIDRLNPRADVSDDERRRRLVASERHKIKNRLEDIIK
ncbi:hypothetical protein DGWBC_0910 [Dehalogenimonas sp. WBC-2]|nr:hypothetical protein DGWBC_0910 [Dehalogenimonas sp. WBC-2]